MCFVFYILALIFLPAHINTFLEHYFIYLLVITNWNFEYFPQILFALIFMRKNIYGS